MRPGMWTSSAPGDVEDMVLDLIITPFPSAQLLVVAIRLVSGYGDRYWIFYVNGQKSLHVFIPEDSGLQTLAIPLFQGAEDIGVHAEDAGDWAMDEYDPDFNAVDFEALNSRCITFNWTATPVLNDQFPG